jgi:hypothetical protein
MSKPFDIYDYVHNNKISLKVEANRKATNVTKGYNDIRKTNLNEVKIVNGKFSIKESLAGDKRPLSNEVKKHFLEIISTYNTFQEQMKRASDLTEVANTLGGIVEAARELTLRETADWFDGVTVKRNMSELDKMDKSFQKFAVEARAMDERLHSLYEDMGHILSRYYEIADIQPDVMRERLGLRKTIKEGKKYDIGSGYKGNGLTIWNRAEEEHGDYKTIAHVSPQGKLSIRDTELPADLKKMFQIWADSMAKGNTGPKY